MEVWLISHAGRFNPRERAPDTHWIGGWVGPTAGLDAMAKTKNSIPPPPRESNPDHPIARCVDIVAGQDQCT
jgi:hypothetical protein